MDIEEIKNSLRHASKTELIDLFPRLQLKQADKKKALIDQIASAELTDDEIENFIDFLDSKNESESDPETELSSNLYITVYRIKEDGEIYEPAADYGGKRAEYFLKSGQIRLKNRGE